VEGDMCKIEVSREDKGKKTIQVKNEMNWQEWVEIPLWDSCQTK
jgi:hypothetical protein